MENIIFTNKYLDFDFDVPIPASSMIPEWYKKTKNYVNDIKKPTNGGTDGTIKKCIPVFDAITSGYLILLPTDLYCEPSEKNNFYFQWPSQELIGFHPIEQVKEYPQKNDGLDSIPKFINPWGIKTPKGYSVFITTPQHRDLPFSILPGIVDTDKYVNAINFPFIINDKNFNGLIPKGTPIAQITPFKRDSWKMSIGSKKDNEEILKMHKKLNFQFFDRYKNLWWNKKTYK